MFVVSDILLWLGVDLGICDVVLMVVDGNVQLVVVCFDWVDVVCDGIVWDFFGVVIFVCCYFDIFEQQFGCCFIYVVILFLLGIDLCILINVLEFVGLEVSYVLDELMVVVDLLVFDNVGVVDIGGGIIGIVIVKQGKVIYFVDEVIGGYYIFLMLVGN